MSIFDLNNQHTSFCKTADSVFLELLDANTRPEQFLDAADVVLDHCRSLQSKPPRNHIHILWEAHRSEHLRPENA